MTKEDKETMAELDKHLPKLSEFFARQPEVVLAYLYGSYATGQTWAESDLDIGVLFDEQVAPLQQFRLVLGYGTEVRKLIQDGVEVDVRELGGAPVEFLMQVIRPGKCLYACTERERVQFETEVMTRYLDFKPVLEEYYHHLRQRIRRGEFSARLGKYIAETRKIVHGTGEAGELPAAVS